MKISYVKYQKLLQAIREYTKGTLKDAAIDNAIFKHLLVKYDRVVFENRKAELMAFSLNGNRNKKDFKNIRSNFKRFINKQGA